ncbi:hypothetical protein NQ024_12885, partial [Corynebacterium sp. 35RC1]|nr:hypothetical protein [Corynebacterium sp. 35RC1]
VGEPRVEAEIATGTLRQHFFAATVASVRAGDTTGAVIVLAKRSIVDVPTALLAVATVLLLVKFKKLPEPVIVAGAALLGLALYPLLHR